MNKSQAFETAYRQLALELGCAPEAFTQPGLTLTPAAFQPGARATIRKDSMLLMVGTGNSIVVSADNRLGALVEELAGKVNGLHRLFEFPALKALDARLREYGRELWGTEHFFLPGGPLRKVPLPEGFRYQWLDEKSVQEFYPNERFPMALVSALSRKIVSQGRLPFYGTAAGNLASQRIAVGCGFVPAWIETDA